MNKQRGGTVTVSGYLLMLLIAAGAASGLTSLWLSQHRTIELQQKVSCTSTVFT